MKSLTSWTREQHLAWGFCTHVKWPPLQTLVHREVRQGPSAGVPSWTAGLPLLLLRRQADVLAKFHLVSAALTNRSQVPVTLLVFWTGVISSLSSPSPRPLCASAPPACSWQAPQAFDLNFHIPFPRKGSPHLKLNPCPFVDPFKAGRREKVALLCMVYL